MRLSLGLLALLGCATAAPPAVDETPLLPTPPPSPVLTSRSRAHAPPPLLAAPSKPGVIRRSDLLRVLDRGPHAFLAAVDPDPLVAGGQFQGWVLHGFRDPRLASPALQPGDVVSRVNGKPGERPEQFMDVWNEMRTAKALELAVTRDGRPVTVRYPIED